MIKVWSSRSWTVCVHAGNPDDGDERDDRDGLAEGERYVAHLVESSGLAGLDRGSSSSLPQLISLLSTLTRKCSARTPTDMASPPRNIPRIPRAHSYSHPERRPSWYAEHLEWARIDLQTALLSHSPPSPPATALKSPKSPKFPLRLRARSPPPPYDSYNDYHYVEAVPNLELHSAAAEGNVGLVHYALTHGQPINSILHGLQPIHAAAAGGSLSALRMLIDRGADVNAPRLPRRYSSEKNKDAPSVGVAGMWFGPY